MNPNPTPVDVHDHLYANGLSSKDLFLIKKRGDHLQLSLNPSLKPRWRTFVQANLEELRADVKSKLEGWPVEIKL